MAARRACWSRKTGVAPKGLAPKGLAPRELAPRELAARGFAASIVAAAVLAGCSGNADLYPQRAGGSGSVSVSGGSAWSAPQQPQPSYASTSGVGAPADQSAIAGLEAAQSVETRPLDATAEPAYAPPPSPTATAPSAQVSGSGFATEVMAAPAGGGFQTEIVAAAPGGPDEVETLGGAPSAALRTPEGMATPPSSDRAALAAIAETPDAPVSEPVAAETAYVQAPAQGRSYPGSATPAGFSVPPVDPSALGGGAASAPVVRSEPQIVTASGPAPTRILFPAGGAAMTAAAETQVAALLDALGPSRPMLLVVGRGDVSTIAMDRALAVRDALIAQGAPAERIDVRAAASGDGGPADRVDILVRPL